MRRIAGQAISTKKGGVGYGIGYRLKGEERLSTKKGGIGYGIDFESDLAKQTGAPDPRVFTELKKKLKKFKGFTKEVDNCSNQSQYSTIEKTYACCTKCPTSDSKNVCRKLSTSRMMSHQNIRGPVRCKLS